MQNFEIKVHIAAPSMVRDDARWRDIAQGVTRFKAASRVLVTDSIVDAIHLKGNVPEMPSTTTTRSPIDLSKGISQSDSLDNGVLDAFTQATTNIRVWKRRAAEDGTITVGQVKRTKRTAHSRTKQGLNPAYRAPGTIDLNNFRMSNVTPRPQTAPEAIVLVPVTASPRPKRSLSDVAHAPSLSLDINKQKGTSECVYETSFIHSPSVCGLGLLNPNNWHNDFDEREFPGNQEQLLATTRRDRQLTSDETVVLDLSQSSWHEGDVAMGTRKRAFETSSRPFNNEPTEFQSLSAHLTDATATPSGGETTSFEISPCAAHSTGLEASLIDLTADTESGEVVPPLPPEIDRRHVLGPVSSPVRPSVDTCQGDGLVSSFQHILNRIRSLPKSVKCSVDNSNMNGQADSYVPQYLLDLAHQFQLAERFLPLQASRDIKNGERGYWLMRLAIRDMGSRSGTRDLSMTSSQWSDQRFRVRQQGALSPTAGTPEHEAHLRQITYPPKDPNLSVSWEAEEFLNFWQHLAKVIRRGRMGYDSRATISTMSELEEGISLEIRVWCWGEVVPHIWLTLNGLSLQRTEEMPLQWCVPGREHPVLAMSGQPHNPGNAHRWIQKDSGLSGSWGLEDTWNGIDVTSPKYS